MKTATLPILVSLIMSLFFVSCEKEEQESNRRDVLLGSWNVIEKEAENISAKVSLRSINDAYVVSISESSIYKNDILIHNFFQLGNDFVVTASVEGDNINIPVATINGTSIRGSGTISKKQNKITWSYWVDMGDGEEVEYHATYSKLQE